MSLTTNLVSYWKLDEASGNAADSVGSNTLTNTGSAAYAAAKINNGIDFGTANTTKYLSNATNIGIAGNGDISISLWVKLRTEITSGTYRLFEFESTTGADRYFVLDYQYNSGTIKLFLNSSATGASYNIALGTSNWYHLIATRNVSGNTSTLYVNGVSVVTSALGSTTDGLNIFRLGATDGAGASFASAYMDEVGVWSRVLTADDVSQLYNSNRALAYPLTAPTLYGAVAYYKLDEASGNASDSVGSNTLTNVNTLTYSSGKINNGAVCSTSGSKHLIKSSSLASMPTGAVTGTINAWVKPYGNSAGLVSIFQWGEEATAKSVGLGFANTGFGIISYSNDSTINYTYQQNAWHMYTVQFNGTAKTYECFVDGSSIGTSTLIATLNIGTVFACIGIQRPGNTTNTFDGQVDEVGVWNRTLSSTEITQLYNGGQGNQYPFTSTSTTNSNFFQFF